MNTHAQIKPDSLRAETLKWKSRQQGDLNYLLYLPANYSDSGKERWPLMLFLHGAGERGSNLEMVAKHGPLSLIKQGTNFPFIIIAPQCAAGALWENEPLLQLLDSVEKNFLVDSNRVYLTGLSMGGYGSWRLGIAHPERFAALVPICGGGNFIDVLLGPGDKGEALKSLPIWAFHGAKDDVVPLAESERMVNQLKRMGVREVKLTVYPEATHNSWAQAYSDPQLYEWLLEKKR